MNWIRKHATFTSLLLGLVSAIITIIGWAIPNSRDWLGRNPGLGWTLAVIFFSTTLWALMWADGAAQERKSEISGLREEVSRLRPKSNATERDTKKFQELIDLWSPRNPIVQGIENLDERRWRRWEVEPFYDFCDQWSDVIFDDAEFESRYAQFFATCKELKKWMSVNGAPTETDSSGEFTYTIASAGEREGGYPEFSRTRKEANELIEKVLGLRKEVERSGRRRGL